MLILAEGFSSTGQKEANRALANRAGRELLVSNESDLVLAAVLLMADEVEAGFRHYFPGLELFLSHNVLRRWGTVGHFTEVRGCC